jgi:intracellular sulfur oxidation DsrE/DsrF family protein
MANLLGALSVEIEIIGDSSKERVEVCTEQVSIGDLIDGVPIVNFGAKYAIKGHKMAYAYFK